VPVPTSRARFPATGHSAAAAATSSTYSPRTGAYTP
jgi:hypothetical protein